jgi:hypothetical protein
VIEQSRFLTEDLLNNVQICGFRDQSFNNAARSSSLNVERNAAYLVTLYREIGYLDVFAALVEAVIDWVDVPEISGDMSAFTANSSVGLEIAVQRYERHRREYCERLRNDRDFRAYVERFPKNVRGVD